MYYKLREEFCLRGWEKLPYGVMIRPENEVKFVTKEIFEALKLCDGTIDCDFFLIPQSCRDLIKELVEEGGVIPCEKGDKITEDQEYRVYNNRYIQAVHWSITGKCNYRCRHCYMSAPEAKLGELSHEVVMDLIDQIADCGIAKVSITGGEPLIRKDFEEIVAKFTEKKIKITQIYSNGYLVNEKLLDMLEKYGQKPTFDMSYDGDDGWHDWLRGIENAGQIVLDAFDLCYERGFPTSSELCIHQGNKHLLRKSLNTLAAHHVSGCKTNPVAPTELWTKSGSEDYSISMDEVFPLYLDYIADYFEDGMPLDLMLGGFFSCGKGTTDWQVPLMKYDGSGDCVRQTVCGHARNYLYLSPEGRMLPCFSLTSRDDIQNAYPLATEMGLKNGLIDSVYMSLIDTRVEEYLQQSPECNACEFRYICAGGCRASALETEGATIMSPDRACCKIFKEGWHKKIEKVAKEAIEKIEKKS